MGCREEKDLSEFSGKQSRCRPCFNDYQNERRKDPVLRRRQAEQVAASNRRLKLRVIEAYGGVCRCCGESNPAFLVLDHVNDDGAEQRKIAGRKASWRWARDRGYPKTLQLLCANCNMAKQFNPGGCPHRPEGQRFVRSTL